MPTPIKLGISIIAVVVTLAAVAFFGYHGKAISMYAAAFLGVFMVISMWIFPEITRTEK